MSGSSEGTSQNPSETEKKSKGGRKGKIIGVWFGLSIWLLILVFSPFRPFEEIWSLPSIFIITNGQLDLPRTVFWVMGMIISASLIYFGIGSVQSSTYQTNIVQTPSEWMVRFIISFCWNALHKEPSIQEDELFKEVSGKIPVISSLEGVVDVNKLVGSGLSSDASGTRRDSPLDALLARLERLSRNADVRGTIITPVELEEGKKSYIEISLGPKSSGGKTEERGASSVHMLLDPHDIPDAGDLPPEVRRALGIPEKPTGGKPKDSSQNGV